MGGGVSGMVIFSRSKSLSFISIFRRVSNSSCDSVEGIPLFRSVAKPSVQMAN